MEAASKTAWNALRHGMSINSGKNSRGINILQPWASAGADIKQVSATKA